MSFALNACDDEVSSGWSSDGDAEYPQRVARKSRAPPSQVTPTGCGVSTSSAGRGGVPGRLESLYTGVQQTRLTAQVQPQQTAAGPTKPVVAKPALSSSHHQPQLLVRGPVPVASPVTVPKSSGPPRKKRVVVNLSRCKYDIVRECVEAMCWTVDEDQEGLAAFANMLKETKEKDTGATPTAAWTPGGVAVPGGVAAAPGQQQVDVAGLLTALLQSERCQILWSDVSVLTQNVARLKVWQRVNHFPQMSLICRKVQLGKQLNRMAAIFPDAYDFFPLSFSSRSDLAAIANYVRKTRNRKTFILKPNAGCQGIGIVLSRQPDRIIPSLPHEDYMVQLYISRPLLIERKKFDMRVYVLVLSVAPLKVLIYDEGLIRMCTKDYVKPRASNMSQTTMHLTNYAVNKKSDDYAFGGAAGSTAAFTTETGRTFTDDGDGSKGYKRDFAFFKRFIEDKFGEHMYALLWQRIERAVVLTILSAYHQLKHAYLASNPASKGSDNRTCFELLGYDVLVDEQCNPYVLEVNHSPSFGTDSAIDYRIKRRLLIDVMKHINPYLVDVKRASDLAYRKMLKKKPWEDMDLHLRGTGFRPIYPPGALEERDRRAEIVKRRKEEEAARAAAGALPGAAGGGDDSSASDEEDQPPSRSTPPPPTASHLQGADVQPRPSAPTPGADDDVGQSRGQEADASDGDGGVESAAENGEDPSDEDADKMRLWSAAELQALYDSVMEATVDTLPGQTSIRAQKAMQTFTSMRRDVLDQNKGTPSSGSWSKPVVADNNRARAPKSAHAPPPAQRSGDGPTSRMPPPRAAAAGSGAAAAALVRRKSVTQSGGGQ